MMAPMKLRLAVRFVFLALALAAVPSCETTKGNRQPIMGDANDDGVIEQSELDDYIAWRFLTAYDRNGDQGVSFAEWKAVNPRASRAAFAKRDTDGDGLAKFEEVRAAVQASPTFGKLMQSIDLNGDGQADRQEVEEFQKHMDEI